jgi:hypothetical protein
MSVRIPGQQEAMAAQLAGSIIRLSMNGQRRHMRGLTGWIAHRPSQNTQ